MVIDETNDIQVVGVVFGTLISSSLRGQMDYQENTYLVFDVTSGKIVAVESEGDVNANPKLLQWIHQAKEMDLYIALTEVQFLVPGFIDTHIHAPQYAYTGTAMDKSLMEWLNEYTFPTEESFQDVRLAKELYTMVVQRTLSEGTTTAMYYATIHLPASKILADLVEAFGQRAFIGMVSMDQNSKGSYVHSTHQNLADAEELIRYIQHKKKNKETTLPLVYPVVTPRFIPTCSQALLCGLSALAKQYDVHIQSHICESLDEMAVVESLYPGQRDPEIFDACGLLTSKTVMAHAVHLTDDEVTLLLNRETSIAHCPLSNFFFANGLLKTNEYLAKGVKIGLGTDVAGGYSPSMLSSMRHAVLAHQTVQMLHAYQEPRRTEEVQRKLFNYQDAFWLATMGGAIALGLASEIGSFQVGKSFDALLVDVCVEGNFMIRSKDSIDDRFQKFINLGDSRNIRRVWVKGKCVHDRNKEV